MNDLKIEYESIYNFIDFVSDEDVKKKAYSAESLKNISNNVGLFIEEDLLNKKEITLDAIMESAGKVYSKRMSEKIKKQIEEQEELEELTQPQQQQSQQEQPQQEPQQEPPQQQQQQQQQTQQQPQQQEEKVMSTSINISDDKLSSLEQQIKILTQQLSNLANKINNSSFGSQQSSQQKPQQTFSNISGFVLKTSNKGSYAEQLRNNLAEVEKDSSVNKSSIGNSLSLSNIGNKTSSSNVMGNSFLRGDSTDSENSSAVTSMNSNLSSLNQNFSFATSSHRLSADEINRQYGTQSLQPSFFGIDMSKKPENALIRPKQNGKYFLINPKNAKHVKKAREGLQTSIFSLNEVRELKVEELLYLYENKQLPEYLQILGSSIYSSSNNNTVSLESSDSVEDLTKKFNNLTTHSSTSKVAKKTSKGYCSVEVSEKFKKAHNFLKTKLKINDIVNSKVREYLTQYYKNYPDDNEFKCTPLNMRNLMGAVFVLYDNNVLTGYYEDLDITIPGRILQKLNTDDTFKTDYKTYRSIFATKKK